MSQMHFECFISSQMLSVIVRELAFFDSVRSSKNVCCCRYSALCGDRKNNINMLNWIERTLYSSLIVHIVHIHICMNAMAQKNRLEFGSVFTTIHRVQH